MVAGGYEHLGILQLYNDYRSDIVGIFDKLNSLLSATVSKQPQETQTIDRRTIVPAQIDDMQKMPASDRYRDKIHRKYYSSYPIKPFISLDRERNSNWLEQAELFPKQAIIPVGLMTPFNDGLLPGHIYLLYWVGKNGQKKVPSYFEYKYGIEFEKEKQFLISNGYLADNKPTSKGADAIVAHFDVIEAHSPEATSAKKAQKQFANSEAIAVDQGTASNGFTVTETHSVNGRNLMLVSDCDKSKVFEGIELVNDLLTSMRKQLKIREALNIPASEIVFNSNFSQKLYTYLEYTPLTASGKQSKYPFELYITTREHYEAMPEFECFGNIGYLKDNRIGSATLNFWYKSKGYHISLGMIDDKLSVKKVEQSLKGAKTTIYKNRF